MKTHEKPLKEIYKDADLVILELPTTKKQYDSTNKWKIQGVSIPKGFKFHSVIRHEITLIIPGQEHNPGNGIRILAVRDEVKS